MPIYVYKCPGCQFVQEVLHRRPYGRNEDVVPHCNDCQCMYELQPTAPAIHFKGGGWAKDGYSKGEK